MNYFLYNKSQKYISRIPNELILEAHYTEEINTAGQLELTIPVKYRLSKDINYICINNPNNPTSYLMFKIITETITDGEATYKCIESAYDELASYTYIQDKRPTMIASDMLSLILQGTRWNVGSVVSTSEKFCSFYYISPLEALQKIVNLWGLEVTFDVEIDGDTNQIKQRNVNLYTKQGKKTNKRFEYGSNLLSVKQIGDTTDLYTALVGRGKGEEVSEGESDTDPDGYGRRITFADVVWNKSNGDPLDKPKGIEYLEDPNATALYGFPDGHPRIGFVVFQDCEDPNELIQLTYNKLQEVNHPQVQFSADIANVGSLDLGDQVAIIRHDIGIEYLTRIFKVEHDLLDEHRNTIELGDNVTQSNSITQQISTIKSDTSDVQNAIDTIVMPSATGNKLYFGTEFPSDGTAGDVFYKDLGNGNTEMYIYQDGGWQLVVSTEQLNTIEKQVADQQADIDAAKQDAETAIDKANEAVSQVGTAQENAQNAIDKATQAVSDLDETKTRLENIAKETGDNSTAISELRTSNGELSSAIATANGDITQLKQTASSLQSSVSDQNGRLSQITQKVDSIDSIVSSNSGDITQLKQTAESLQSTISSKADISQVTQLSDLLRSTILEVGPVYPNGDFSNSNLTQFYDTEGFVFWSNNDIAFGQKINDMHLSCDSTEEKTVAYLKQILQVKSKNTFVLNFDSCTIYTENSQSLVYLHEFNNKGEEISNSAKYTKYDESGEWYHNSLTWDLKASTEYVRVEWVVWSNGNSIETLITNVECKNGDNLISEITQLKDDINLRVQKGDVISQINIEAGKTLIQSDTLYLDADTVTFSGKAFIPSAAIKDLSADKITTGTLNASNVNIINLDVKNLVGNTTDFVKSHWQDAFGSHVNIDGSGMSISYGDWYTKFDQSGMHFKNGSQDIGAVGTIGMQGMPSDYEGLTLTAGADAEFFALSALDYKSANSTVPPKLLWMRQGINTAGYNTGWNFLDDVHLDNLYSNHLHYGGFTINWGIVSGKNGFKALTLTSGYGNGIYWGSDGSFGFVTNGNSLHNFSGTSIPTHINGDGTVQTWYTI